jgi:hypothetical protein
MGIRLVSLMFAVMLYGLSAGAQDSLKRFRFTGYAEAYYSFDLNRPADNRKPPFFYSFNRHDQPRFNIAMVDGSYTSGRFRANLGLMAGTYSASNLAQEPQILRHLYEANIGLRIGQQLWLDAGVMPSHIGLESAIGKDCISLTRSIMADNSPYFESGARLSYTKGKWYAALLLLNGWQRIRPIPGNTLPSFGHQLQFKPNERLTLNSSSFIGTDKPDAERRMRYFHNFYMLIQASGKVDLQFAFDVGAEQQGKGSSRYHNWWTTVGGFRFKPFPRLWFCTLMEYYADQGGVLTTTDTGLPLQTFGFSETADVHINKYLQWRVEWRYLNGRGKIYERNGIPWQSNNAITTSLAFSW